MGHAISPRMSRYRVMHTDYMRTHVHTYYEQSTIICAPSRAIPT